MFVEGGGHGGGLGCSVLHTLIDKDGRGPDMGGLLFKSGVVPTVCVSTMALGPAGSQAVPEEVLVVIWWKSY